MFAHMTEIAAALGAAWLAGSLIGIERSYHGRAAGFRTHALVAIAAASAIVLTLQPSVVAGVVGGGARLDPSRLGQGVLTGVGFIGAGVIFKEGVSVQGLTTAAFLWAPAVIGMLCGAGMFAAAGLVSLERGWLRLEAGAAPYARAIASVFDAYRTEERSFSSAI